LFITGFRFTIIIIGSQNIENIIRKKEDKFTKNFVFMFKDKN